MVAKQKLDLKDELAKQTSNLEMWEEAIVQGKEHIAKKERAMELHMLISKYIMDNKELADDNKPRYLSSQDYWDMKVEMESLALEFQVAPILSEITHPMKGLKANLDATIAKRDETANEVERLKGRKAKRDAKKGIEVEE